MYDSRKNLIGFATFHLLRAKLSVPVDHTARANFSTNLVCQRDPPKSVRAHRSCSFTTTGHDQTPQRSRPNLRRPFAPTVQVRSRPEFATKPAQRSRPSTSVSPTSHVRRRPPEVFVRDQRSRPNTTSVHDQTPRFLPRRPVPLPRRSTRSGHTCGANI